jgi:hypothetical protein
MCPKRLILQEPHNFSRTLQLLPVWFELLILDLSLQQCTYPIYFPLPMPGAKIIP